MTRHCACGKAWEGEGACPQCFLLQAVKIERLEEKVGLLQEGFASIVKIAADTPTAAPKPPGIGPLMSAAWRIRQLGKERKEALEKVRTLKEDLAAWAAIAREIFAGAGAIRLDVEERLQVALNSYETNVAPLMPSGPLGEAEEDPAGSHTKPIAIEIPGNEDEGE